MFRFDERNPHLLIAIEETHTHSITPYQQLMQRWVARSAQEGAFGVVMVNAEHAADAADDDGHDDDGHDHDGHDHDERDVAFEEAFTRLINDFRREHRATAARSTVGFARVLAPSYTAERLAADPNALAEMSAHWNRTTQYMYGVPGAICATLDDACAWLEAQWAAFVSPAGAAEASAAHGQGGVGLFYGSTTGVTEVAALAIAQAWAAHGLEPLTPVNIGTVKDLTALQAFDALILGVSTWNVGQLQDDWAIALPQLDALDLSGIPVALFGLGDQYGYPENFVDGIGILGAKLAERGAFLVGAWPTDGYTFTASQAVVGGRFIGLPLDEVHQPEQTAARITAWVAQLAAMVRAQAGQAG
jgi:flavodoxin long chain